MQTYADEDFCVVTEVGQQCSQHDLYIYHTSCSARGGIGEAAVDSIMSDILFVCNKHLSAQMLAIEREENASHQQNSVKKEIFTVTSHNLPRNLLQMLSIICVS